MKTTETKRCRNIRRVLIALFVVCGYLLSTTFISAYVTVDGKEKLITETALNLTFGSVSGSTHTSGLVGFTDGDSNTQNTIENCLVQANVTCSAHFGGLVGHGLNSKVVITGCAFTGNMAIPNKDQYAGGHNNGHGGMDKRSTVIVPQDVYREGRGERSERGTSCGEPRHYKADNEKCRHKASCGHKAAPSHCGEQFI